MSTSLETENELLLQFVYACPIGLLEIAADGTIRMINPLAMQLLLPIAPTPVIANLFALLENYAPELRNLLDDFFPSQGTVCENHRILISPCARKESEEARVLACTLVKLDSHRFVATLSDVSRQVAQERRLKQAESWFASLLDSVDDFAVLSIDAAGCINAVNPSVLRQTGFSEAETLGRTLTMFDVPGFNVDDLNMHDQIAVARGQGWYLNEAWQKRCDGKVYWCQRLIAARSDEPGSDGFPIAGYTVVLREVTRQKLDASNLRQMLTRDHLTGACNRSHFFEIAEREFSRSIRYSSAIALIAIDLDNFKQVNDTHGHGAGDEVLKVFSQACMGLLRPSDTFARIGGEEFVVLLPSTDLKGASELAERLRTTIASTATRIAGSDLYITASLGCADTRGAAISLTALLAAADRALYSAKQRGRDCVTLSSELPLSLNMQ